MEYITTDTPVSFYNVTLIPVVRIYLHGNNTSYKDITGHWLFGHKEPLAIIVCDANSVRALTISSSEMSIDALMQKIPDLSLILAPYRQHG